MKKIIAILAVMALLISAIAVSEEAVTAASSVVNGSCRFKTAFCKSESCPVENGSGCANASQGGCPRTSGTQQYSCGNANRMGCMRACK